MLLEPHAQELGLPLCLVGGEPREGHLGVQQPLEHADCHVRLGGELDFVRNARGSTAGAVVGPGLGKLELPIADDFESTDEAAVSDGEV